MKKIFSMFLIVLLVSCPFFSSIAEDIIIEKIDGYLTTIVDCSEKELWTLNSTNYDEQYCTIQFDLRDGWKSIAIDDGNGRYRSHFFFSNDEILSSFINALLHFNQIKLVLPAEKELRLELIVYDKKNERKDVLSPPKPSMNIING